MEFDDDSNRQVSRIYDMLLTSHPLMSLYVSASGDHCIFSVIATFFAATSWPLKPFNPKAGM